MVPDSSFYVPEKSMTSGRSSFGEPQALKNSVCCQLPSRHSTDE